MVYSPIQGNVSEVLTEIQLPQGKCVIRHLEPRSSSQGMPVLLLPGIGGFAETYLYNFPPLIEAGFRPMAVDNLGFGKSTFPLSLQLTPEIFSVVLAKWIDSLKIDEFFVAGNSFGGGVAIGLWPLKKEKIKGLILISSAGFERDVWFPYKLASLPLINHITVRLAINGGGLRGMNGRNSWKSIVYEVSKVPDFIVDMNAYFRTKIETRAAYEFILKEMMTIRGQNPKLIHEIHAISKNFRKHKKPVLIIWGKNDKIIPNSHGKIAAELTGGVLHIIDQCGHMPYLEHPEKVSHVMTDFLQNYRR